MEISRIDVKEDKDPRKNAILKNVKNRMLTLEGAKELYAEVMELYSINAISERNMKALVYGFNNYLPYLKFEADLRIEERLDRIEEKLGDK